MSDESRAPRFAGAEDRIVAALLIIHDIGDVDGAHHKQWVLDQVVRTLMGDGYDQWVAAHCEGEDGPQTYGWDTGIAP